MEDFLNALKIRLIKIFRNCAKGEEQGIKSLFDDVLITADHIYVLAAKAIDRVDKLKS